MFILTAKMPRRRIFLVSAGIAALLLVSALLLFSDAPDAAPLAADNAARVAYLESFGWDVLPEPVETLSVTLPDTLDEPYLSYNELQREQGFDLSSCCAQTLSRYTYLVTNYPARADCCQADLYLCEDRIVAGDIICTGEDGFIAPLQFPGTP